MLMDSIRYNNRLYFILVYQSDIFIDVYERPEQEMSNKVQDFVTYYFFFNGEIVVLWS